MLNDTRSTITGHGWLLHGLQAPGQATIAHAELACDEEFARFLTARLEEEAQAAVRRARRSRRDDAGLELLHELARDLQQGRLPDDVVLDLVLAAYAAHPDFKQQWRVPAELVPAAQSVTRSAS